MSFRIRRPGPGVLVLRDNPGCFWLLGLLFVGVGGLVAAGLAGAFENLDQVSPLEKALAWVLALAALGAGLWTFYRSPQSRIEVRAGDGTLTVRRRGLLRAGREVYALADVADVLLDQTSDIDGDPVHRLAMRLHGDSDLIPLSLLWLHDRPGLEQAAREIQTLLPNGKSKENKTL